jgi:general secretion pathway protein G
MSKARKGFTLVELLIVIVIIGILAGGMMLANGAATSSATATVLVSDLRALSAAAVMYFTDNMDSASPDIANLYPYMNDSKKMEKDGNYKFEINTEGWFVGYENGKLKDMEVRKKLEAKSGDLSLYAGPSTKSVFSTSTEKVYMKAR